MTKAAASQHARAPDRPYAMSLSDLTETGWHVIEIQEGDRREWCIPKHEISVMKAARKDGRLLTAQQRDGGAFLVLAKWKRQK